MLKAQCPPIPRCHRRGDGHSSSGRHQPPVMSYESWNSSRASKTLYQQWRWFYAAVIKILPPDKLTVWRFRIIYTWRACLAWGNLNQVDFEASQKGLGTGYKRAQDEAWASSNHNRLTGQCLHGQPLLSLSPIILAFRMTQHLPRWSTPHNEECRNWKIKHFLEVWTRQQTNRRGWGGKAGPRAGCWRPATPCCTA